jgi:hypothetical protein
MTPHEWSQSLAPPSDAWRLAAALIGASILAAGLAGCQPQSPQADAQQKIQGCANEAEAYLDPHWAGQRQVTGVYPTAEGDVQAVLAAGGVQVTVRCGIASGYYMHVLADIETIEGVRPAPGQLYLPAQHRWLTDAELHAHLTDLLAPRPGEYDGARWSPNNPADYTVADMANVPSTSCFTLQSRLEPARQLVACQTAAAGHRYWVNERLLAVEVATPPGGLPPIPLAPPPDMATQPGGAPH